MDSDIEQIIKELQVIKDRKDEFKKLLTEMKAFQQLLDKKIY